MRAAALVRAWEVVRRNDEEDGVRTAGTDRFAADLMHNLERIASTVTHGTYRPEPLVRVTIPKHGGGTRKLSIPTVPDRVLERSLATVLSELSDPWFTPWSFAYRVSLSPVDAHRALATERDAGATHVVRADLKDCFDRFDRRRVIESLRRRVADDAVADLVRWLCARPSLWRGSLRTVDRGVAQGGLCAAAHNDPYEQCWVMRSVGSSFLVRGWSRSVRCA